MSDATQRHDAALRERIRRHLEGFDRHEHAEAGLTRAAVAAVFLEDEHGAASFVLTRRAARLSAHAGQWALPGGRLDPGEGPAEAALRELSEEVGLELGADSVLGWLDDYPTRSGYCITPVVTWAEAGAHLVPDPSEVAAVYRVPLGELEGPDVPRLRRIPESDRPILSLQILGHEINAPTAAILYQLREVAIHGRATRVAHYDQPVFAWK